MKESVVSTYAFIGWTPLHEACNHGFLDIAKFLLEAGAIVNSKGFHDDYPLHDAVMNEHTDVSCSDGSDQSCNESI